MSVLAMLPGTSEHLLSALGIRGESQIRKRLRRLERATDALLAVTWIIARSEPVLLEFSGDSGAMPVPFPKVPGTVPAYVEVLDRDGEKHDAVVHRLRPGRDLPYLGLAVIGFGVAEGPALIDVVEDFGEAIEDVIVDAVAGETMRGAGTR